MAAMLEKADVLRLLLDRGADIHAEDHEGGTPLHCAAQNRSKACAAALLENGAEANVADGKKETPLFRAVRRARCDAVVALLIDAGARVGARNVSRLTPLHEAASLQIAALLLRAGADVNARDSRGETLLKKKLREELTDLDWVELLVSHGANPNERDGDGVPVLHWALHRSGHSDVVDLLLKSGAHPDAADKRGQTPLHVLVSVNWNDGYAKALLDRGARVSPSHVYAAAAKKRLRIAELFLDRMVNAGMIDESLVCAWRIYERHKSASFLNTTVSCLRDKRCSSFHSPLFWALRKKAPVLLSRLLATPAGTDLETPTDELEFTLLFAAARQGAARCALVLLAHGASMQARDGEGRTALHHAVRHRNVRVAKLLVDVGIDFRAKDNAGDDAWDWLRRGGRRSSVLSHYKAKLEEWDRQGKHPMTAERAHYVPWAVHMTAERKWYVPWAAREGLPKVVRFLITNRADLNVKDDKGRTPLELAALGGHAEVGALLLEHGAVPSNGRQQFWGAMLRSCVLKGREETVRIALDHGADPNRVRCDEDATPLHVAARRGHQDIVALLLSHRADSGLRDKHGRTPIHGAVQTGKDGVATVCFFLIVAQTSMPEMGTAGQLFTSQ